jgi:hypothetical protein
MTYLLNRLFPHFDGPVCHFCAEGDYADWWLYGITRDKDDPVQARRDALLAFTTWPYSSQRSDIWPGTGDLGAVPAEASAFAGDTGDVGDGATPPDTGVA